MKKLIALLFVVSVSIGTMNALTKLYLDVSSSSVSTWPNAGAVSQAWIWGNGNPGSWTAAFGLVAGETHLYEVEVPEGTSGAVVYRRSPSHSMDAFDGNHWNKTEDVNMGSGNCVKVLNWNGGAGELCGASSITYTPPAGPSVSITVPSAVYLDETISFSAVSANVISPVYTYSVQEPGSSSFVSATSPYQPLATGTYTFKVEVAESNALGTVLASDAKNVVVKAVPAPITIKAKILPVPDVSWEGEISFYFWSASGSGFVSPTNEGGWYSYTFERMESVNVIFVNGNDWPAPYNATYQSKNVENITESTCFEVGELDKAGDWKRTVVAVPCSESEPIVSLTIQSEVYLDEQITFSASSENVTDPVYVYWVQTPGSSSFVPVSSPYQPLATGTHAFKVTVAESSASGTVLASDEKNVIVKAVPAPITIKMKIEDNEFDDTHGNTITWTDVRFYAWTGPDVIGFVTPTQEGDWYSYTFERLESVNVVFLHAEDNGWPIYKAYQSKDVENITQSTCFEVQGIDFAGDWKRTVAVVDCPWGVSIDNIRTASPVSISSENKIIRATFDGRAQIELYAVTGQLLRSETAENQFTYPVSSGIYLLRINGKAFKVLAR